MALNSNKTKTQVVTLTPSAGDWDTAGATLDLIATITQIGNLITVALPITDDTTSTNSTISMVLKAADAGYDAALAARMSPGTGSYEAQVVPIVVFDGGITAARVVGQVSIVDTAGVPVFTISLINNAVILAGGVLTAPASFRYNATIVAGSDNQA